MSRGGYLLEDFGMHRPDATGDGKALMIIHVKVLLARLQ
jgi:hypothetical protein